MRQDQFMGITEEAATFLGKNEVKSDKCKTCGCISPQPLEEISVYCGMFGDEHTLFRHQLKDGRYADEFLQTYSWSSGPMFFIGIKVNQGREFLWTQAAIGGTP